MLILIAIGVKAQKANVQKETVKPVANVNTVSKSANEDVKKKSTAIKNVSSKDISFKNAEIKKAEIKKAVDIEHKNAPTKSIN